MSRIYLWLYTILGPNISPICRFFGFVRLAFSRSSNLRAVYFNFIFLCIHMCVCCLFGNSKTQKRILQLVYRFAIDKYSSNMNHVLNGFHLLCILEAHFTSLFFPWLCFFFVHSTILERIQKYIEV